MSGSLRGVGVATLCLILCSASAGTDGGITFPLSGEGRSAWSLKNFEGVEAEGSVVFDERGYRDSEPCLVLRHLSGGFRFGAQAEFSLSGREKDSGLVVLSELACFDGGLAQVAVEAFDANGRSLGLKEGASSSERTWTAKRWRFGVPARAVRARIYLLSLAGGGVRYAHVSVRQTDDAAEELPLQVRCYPVGCTADWNDGKRVFNTFADAPLPLTFHFKGDREKLRSPAFEIDLPGGFRITDAYSTHSSFSGGSEPVSVTRHERNGRPYDRYRYENLQTFRILQTGYGWERKTAFVIEPKAECAVPAVGTVYYRCADESRAGEESELEVSMTLLPKDFRRPRRFTFMSWCNNDRLCSKDDVFLRVSRAFEAAGATSFTRTGDFYPRGRHLVELLRARDRGWFFPFGFPDYWVEKFHGGEAYKALKKRYAKHAEPKKSQTLCPDYFNTDPAFRAYYEKMISGRLRDAGVVDGDWITLDFEPWGASRYCYCETCLGKFAAEAGLAETPPTDALTDPARLLDKWCAFRCRQCEATIRQTCEIIRRYNPKLVICDYDYIQLHGTGKEHLFYRGCAKDTKLNEKWFDQHMCSYYHVLDLEAFKSIRNNTRHLEKPYFPVAANDGSGGYLSKKEVRHPRQLRQLALAAFVHGCPGFASYSGDNWDGAQLYAVMKARDEIAALEDYPWGREEGALTAETDETAFAFATTAKGRDQLIALFNYNREKPANVRVRLRDGRATGFSDPVTGASFDATQVADGVLTVSVPRDGVRFVKSQKCDFQNNNQ